MGRVKGDLSPEQIFTPHDSRHENLLINYFFHPIDLFHDKYCNQSCAGLCYLVIKSYVHKFQRTSCSAIEVCLIDLSKFFDIILMDWKHLHGNFYDYIYKI